MLSEIFTPDNYRFLNYYSIPNLLIALSFLFLGIFIVYKQPKRMDSRIAGMYSFAFFWWQGWFFLAYNCINAGLIYWLLKIGFIGVIFIAFLISHQTFLIIKMAKVIKRIIYPNYLMALFLSIMLLSSNMILDKPMHHFWGFYTTGGKFFTYFIVYYLLVLSLSFTALMWQYIFNKNKYNGVELLRMKSFIISYLIGVIAIVDFLPNYGFEIYPFGYICFATFALALSYGIIKYNFFDIETAFHQTLAWIVSSALVIVPLTLISAYFFSQVEDPGIFVYATFFLLMYLAILIYKGYIQPSIDSMFLKKKYKYEDSLVSIIEKSFKASDLKVMGNDLIAGVYDLLYPKNACFFVRNNNSYDLVSCLDIKTISKYATSVDGQILRWILENKKPLYKNHYLSDPKSYSIGQELISWPEHTGLEVAVPIFFSKELIGILALSKKKNLKEYSFMDLRLLDNICKGISLAINNLIFYQQNIDQERTLKEKLEDEVLKRTTELVKKNKELAQFNEMAVDRELKMVDLKKRVKVLEESLAVQK